MKSVERLKTEHDLIERGLNLLEDAVARIKAGQPLPEGFPQWAPRFFQQFADQCHHAKEEDVFFPLLKRRGIPEQGGPIGVMLHEHVLGRDCVGRMREASQTQTFDAGKFADAAKQYIPLLRQHIFKENNVLFHMAERVMSEADDADVTGRFSQVEQERGLTGLHENFASDVARWEQALIGGATSMSDYTLFLDLAKEARPPDKGILSRTLFSDDRLKAVLFGFAQGEELSEHTASMPAVLHFLQGEAKLTLNDDTVEARSGTWVHMPKGMRHSIQATTPVVMVLLLLK